MAENTDNADTGLLVTLSVGQAQEVIRKELTCFTGFGLDEGHDYIESQPTSSSPASCTAWLTGMDQPPPKPAQDSIPAFTLTVEQFRQLVREEVQATRANQQDADRLLNAEEAASLLSVSEDWLYRHAKKLPFTRKLGPKMLRFSYQGITKYLASRQATKN